jgi:SAM-dependent methyltransferase
MHFVFRPVPGEMNGAIKAMVKAVLPAALVGWIQKQRRRWSRRPPVGWVRFGSLRRLDPVDSNFGFGWGQVIDRYYIERFLDKYASDIHGRVLEVAGNRYTQRFGGKRVSRSDVLHSVTGHPKTTIIADLTDARDIPSNAFDCIILTQTLQCIYDVRAAIKTVHRILKPGGTLLVTCHGISQISRYDMDRWGEYWRFTSLSARKLFTEVFREDHIVVQAYGNVIAATAFLHGLTVQDLRRQELDYHDPNYEVILGIRALKQGSGSTLGPMEATEQIRDFILAGGSWFSMLLM